MIFKNLENQKICLHILNHRDPKPTCLFRIQRNSSQKKNWDKFGGSLFSDCVIEMAAYKRVAGTGRENGKKTRGKRISSKGVGKGTFKLRRIREITLGNSNEKGEKNEERKKEFTL